MSQQLTLDWEPGRVDQCRTLKAYIRQRIASKPGGKIEKAIAADMDLSPTDLSRKLANNPHDRRNFSVDDLEAYIAVTGDVEPIYYLVEKFIDSSESRRERAVEQIAAIVPELQRLLVAAGINQATKARK